MNPKQGLVKKGNGESMSKWSIPTPAGYKPETAPAKPQGGSRGGAMASKTANTPSGTHGMVGNIKSKY